MRCSVDGIIVVEDCFWCSVDGMTVVEDCFRCSVDGIIVVEDCFWCSVDDMTVVCSRGGELWLLCMCSNKSESRSTAIS